MSVEGLHAIELAAHTLLSGSLDNLNENFDSLNQSQVIILTRLKIIEKRLSDYKQILEDNNINERELSDRFTKIKELRKRLDVCIKTLERVEQRVDRMNTKLDSN
ncbi:uncharacterized protein SPAPADRAFT_156849 [Spathaspora passalidarum NRRL Y-27907]|uniref:Biogenesis of lysosome-related organelles complex 1 subunit SNN1 n=1 Tax=Spathaspora passalidarum (strain NRRL Y-27907 / 11-Y1) TaxID=619300 RepID=G3ASR2_SPAPN|nr:uncharacterized protein SPAPADRAFT_156849 [Spathaspora passalidarum NRRL Y-27907]EGW31126.1 hypothetical protein SPAPADRAFT_156849 [Spathaspora passalidarum NRRL Y-27907]